VRKPSLILGLLAFALPNLMASPDNADIIRAAESYLKANATVTTEVKYIVEQVEGDLARVRVNPADKPTKSTAWIFLKKQTTNGRG
jgi:type II secretory pathway pseudopilin PulG